MRKKQLSVLVGAVMGLTVAVPATVLGAGTEYQGATGQVDRQAAQRTSAIMQMQASELQGRSLVSPDGEMLGTITNVVQSKEDQSLHAVVSVGGFMGVGADRVTYPIADLDVRGDDIVASTTMDQLQQRTAYNEADYTFVADDQRLAAVAGEAIPGVGVAEIASFEEVDDDNDGVVGREELREHDLLTENWQQFDLDNDQMLNSVEFAAFENALEPVAPAAPEARAPDGMPDGQLSSFEELDADDSGNISRQEARQHDALSASWQEVDVDNDDQIDQAEFAAFEAGWEAAPDGGAEAGAFESPRDAGGDWEAAPRGGVEPGEFETSRGTEDEATSPELPKFE